MGHFESGLNAKDVALSSSEPAEDAETAALLLGLGRSQPAVMQRVQIPEAMTNLRRAFEFYASAGDVDRVMAVVETQYVPLPGHSTGMAELIGRALELIPPDSERTGRLLCLYGKALGWEEGDFPGAIAALDRALSLARRDNDAVLEMQTLAESCIVNFTYLHWQDALDSGLRAIELSSMGIPLLTTTINPDFRSLGWWTALVGSSSVRLADFSVDHSDGCGAILIFRPDFRSAKRTLLGIGANRMAARMSP